MTFTSDEYIGESKEYNQVITYLSLKHMQSEECWHPPPPPPPPHTGVKTFLPTAHKMQKQ